MVSTALIMTGALVGIGPGVATASTCVSWTGTAPANPSSVGDRLYGVSAVSPCDVWAVGDEAVGNQAQTLAEYWNGLMWTVAPSSNPGGSLNANLLVAVAVKSSTDGWAVGHYNNGTADQTLIEELVGGDWEQVSSPNPAGPKLDNSLDAVTIISARNAWAVGRYSPTALTGRAFIAHWNGAAWKAVRSPNPGGADSDLLGVTATSARDVWAVGYHYDSFNIEQTLIEHWNGTTWKRLPSPNPGGSANSAVFSAVAASSPSNAWAVGGFFNGHEQTALIAHWNGKTWRRVTSASLVLPHSSLSGVTVLSATNAWAVGTFADPGNLDLAAHWNGKAWTQVPSPDPGAFYNAFSAVAASSPADIWAVGAYSNNSGLQPLLTMAFHCC